MTNFKRETLEAIEESNHEVEDVMFVGSYDGKYRININNFLENSDFVYDNGYGFTEIPTDLIVYFYDRSYLSRDVYDGSEWWEYNEVLDYKETDDYIDYALIWNINFRMKRINKEK